MNKGLRQLLRKSPSSVLKQCRFFLSQAYLCEDVWEKRLSDPLIKDIKPVDFYYDLIKKYKKEGKVSAIDADLFINRIQPEGKDNLVDEIDEVLRLLRRSPETVKSLTSTHHATMRYFMRLNQKEMILKVLSDPTNYGFFPCYYLANVLMDYFIKEKDFTGSARVASCLMLQEDFGPKLTQALVLHSCFMYATNGESNAPWVDYNVVEEPEEEVKVLVAYIRNPYFDDHFDIKNPSHIVGKTLAWLSPNLHSEYFKSNAEVLGFALYQKYDQLYTALMRVSNNKCVLDERVVAIVAREIEDCEDISLKTSIESQINALREQKCVSETNIEDQIDKLVKDSYSQVEEGDIQNQVRTMESWGQVRRVALDAELELIERRRIIAEIEEKKKYLKEKEEVLFFFDHKLKYELKYEEKQSEMGEDKAAEEEYMPPELR